MDILPIAQITIGERRRDEYGDIDALAASIKRYGLLHPVVISADRELVAGSRRLAACISLGWSDIPVRCLGELTPQELREIELEENLRRKDLTPYEQSKVISERAAVAGEILAQTELCAESTHKGPGRRSNPRSRRSVADHIATPEPTIRAAEQHVATAETYPFMQTWPQYNVLEARTHLEKIPETERPMAAALIDRPGIPPKDACAMLGNVASKPDAERAEIYGLATSDDDRKQSLAITKAASLPSMPDPRSTWLQVDVVKRGRAFIKQYPDDPHTSSIQGLVDYATAIIGALREG